MTKNRDDFSKSTTEILAKRVGYLCSNPSCRKPTIGANDIKTKSTSIGIAAHITAASSKGPRYDENISSEQRSSIDNGIWLCSNCAALIDKNYTKYTIQTLNIWKRQAEDESAQKLNGEFKSQKAGSPFIEAELIWTFGGRWKNGFSNKNPREVRDGREIIVFSPYPIIHWTLNWHYTLMIHNNSNHPAFNINIESIGDLHFTHLDKLNKINNLPPLENIELNAKYEEHFEGLYSEADEILKPKIPIQFNALVLRIKYLDECRNEHVSFVKFDNGNLINERQ